MEPQLIHTYNFLADHLEKYVVSLGDRITDDLDMDHLDVAQWLRDNCVSQHLSGAGSSPAGSVGRDLNLQKLNYQYLTTSVAVVLVVR